MELSLNGVWKVSHVPYKQEIENILEDSFVPEGWLDARIPEDIHSTLRKAGLIKGNTYNKDEDEEVWIEDRDWIYYREFFVQGDYSAKRVLLNFEGLDTFCHVYLNGKKIGFGENMHTPLRLDVGGVIKLNERNVLIVRFYSPIKYVETMNARGIFSITTSDRILARKAQMNYSWDFCGRCVTTGIWKPVTLEAYDNMRISSHYIYTEKADGSSAQVGLKVEVESVCGERPKDYSILATMSKESDIVFEREGTIDDFRSMSINISNPSLWWPRPYGPQELYDFTMTLKKNGEAVQEISQKFGIRTVEIIQEKQVDGKSFIFAVNGRRLFIRGANWVPVNTVYTDITNEDYEDLIDYAVGGNISMLRIWGGGIYESKRMFELCDKKGIMIWNDFMFSCGIYPQNPEFLANTAAEAEFVIKEYRNYTSLVIWAGDNENGQAYGWAGRPYEFLDDKISNVVLKEACESLDPNRFYLPTSPCSPDELYKGGDNPQSPYQGDMHLYIMSADPGVNSNRDYGKNYYKRVLSYRPRFMSEFGFICLPEKDTFYKFNFLKEKIRYKNELAEFLPFAEEYIENCQHDKAIYFSQVYNSMALKYWIEYFRSLKWICSGSLYWKFNDPVADSPRGGIFPTHMSTVDMYRKPKMTYYYTRRAYDDVVIVCIETENGYKIVGCNENLEDYCGTLTIKHMDFSGSVLGRESAEVTVKGDSATCLYEMENKQLEIGDIYSEYIKIEFKTHERTYENRYFFADINEINRLKLKNSGLKVTDSVMEGTKIRLKLTTEFYARNVRVNILDRRAEYSDNYFEMDAGSDKEVVIILHNAAGVEDTVVYVEGENTPRIALPVYTFLK